MIVDVVDSSSAFYFFFLQRGGEGGLIGDCFVRLFDFPLFVVSLHLSLSLSFFFFFHSPQSGALAF